MIREQVIATLVDAIVSGMDDEDLLSFARTRLLSDMERLSNGELRGECQLYEIPIPDEQDRVLRVGDKVVAREGDRYEYQGRVTQITRHSPGYAPGTEVASVPWKNLLSDGEERFRVILDDGHWAWGEYLDPVDCFHDPA